MWDSKTVSVKSSIDSFIHFICFKQQKNFNFRCFVFFLISRVKVTKFNKCIMIMVNKRRRRRRQKYERKEKKNIIRVMTFFAFIWFLSHSIPFNGSIQILILFPPPKKIKVIQKRRKEFNCVCLLFLSLIFSFFVFSVSVSLINHYHYHYFIAIFSFVCFVNKKKNIQS